jgi:hypothetical protein
LRRPSKAAFPQVAQRYFRPGAKLRAEGSLPAIERDGADPFTLHFPISAKQLQVSRRILSQVTEQLDLEIQENMPLQINREKVGKLTGFAFCGQLFQGVVAALVLWLSGQ